MSIQYKSTVHKIISVEISPVTAHDYRQLKIFFWRVIVASPTRHTVCIIHNIERVVDKRTTFNVGYPIICCKHIYGSVESTVFAFNNLFVRFVSRSGFLVYCTNAGDFIK